MSSESPFYRDQHRHRHRRHYDGEKKRSSKEHGIDDSSSLISVSSHAFHSPRDLGFVGSSPRKHISPISLHSTDAETQSSLTSSVGLDASPFRRDIRSSRVSMTQVDDFLQHRDYTGALALLEYQLSTGSYEKTSHPLPWIAYAAFHLGDYKRAMETYQELLAEEDSDPRFHTFLACCFYQLGMFAEANSEVRKGPMNAIAYRLLLHLAHQTGDETNLMKYHQKMKDTLEDQISIAAVHYMRSHYQEAEEIFKRKLEEHSDYLALHVYIALCYYQLDYYDISLDVLERYLKRYPDSAMALNLKACIAYRLYSGQAAEEEIRVLVDLHSSATAYGFTNDVVQHNLVVFRNGEDAPKILYPLLDIIREARTNLVIYHLRNGSFREADELLRNVDPRYPVEYVIKGVVKACIGQAEGDDEELELARQYFQLVGSSSSECDTIVGRQSMACSFHIMGQFDEAVSYLRTIEPFCGSMPEFQYNLGICLAGAGMFKEAEEHLRCAYEESTAYHSNNPLIQWLARSYIANRKPQMAFALFERISSNGTTERHIRESFLIPESSPDISTLQIEDSNQDISTDLTEGSESSSSRIDLTALLRILANDFFSVSSFFFAAKSFEELSVRDPSRASEYWEGLRSSIINTFVQVVNGIETTMILRDLTIMLRRAEHIDSKEILQLIEVWALKHGIALH